MPSIKTTTHGDNTPPHAPPQNMPQINSILSAGDECRGVCAENDVTHDAS
ncbi:hypothetical protein [Muribaculum intestinale]|nr:hypothetical protein [Muribaculum intestinale]QQR08361.1 hypothetical protein I5Q90_10085 [Muribaculum intestinale]